MTVIAAMFMDAYRELNSKKLFWVTLALSGLVVLVYASIGFDEDGMLMFFGLKSYESDIVTKGSPIARMLYRGIFSSFIVGLWLAWIAIILALISTTTIFPDFVSGGSVELVLCRPITRIKLFFIKYIASLLFVLLQVSIFCVGVFICLGWRLGDWNWIIFAAIPLVTLLYSYLYAVNVLVGLVTRSALAALLMTLLFWFSLFGINLSDGIVNTFKTQFTVELERQEESVQTTQTRLDALADEIGEDAELQRTRYADMLESQQDERDKHAEAVQKLTWWHTRVRAIQAVLPKTAETVALLDRWLKEDTDVNLMDVLSGNVATNERGEFVPEQQSTDREVGERMTEEMESRSVTYVVGTSLIFEAVVLALACFVFVRRDY